MSTPFESATGLRRARHDLLERLDEVSTLDAHRLRRRIRRATSAHLPELEDRVARAAGAGKTARLLKSCLELGRGVRGTIGHTQPRRLAARTVAERVSHELGQHPGGLVGSAVRFDDRTGPDTAVKIMKDGLLLGEI